LLISISELGTSSRFFAFKWNIKIRCSIKSSEGWYHLQQHNQIF
jgi:hypothetical protein